MYKNWYRSKKKAFTKYAKKAAEKKSLFDAPAKTTSIFSGTSKKRPPPPAGGIVPKSLEAAADIASRTT